MGLRIGIDVDDVLFDLCGHIQRIADDKGISAGRQIDHWNIHESYGVPREVLWDAIFDEYREGLLLEAPIEGVAAILSALQEEHGHEVHLVTARGFEGQLGAMVREDTIRWVHQYNLAHSSLTFTLNKGMIRVDAFLDDNEHNVQDVSLAGCPLAYLMNAQHNQASSWRRVGSLDEFAAKIEPNWVSPLASADAA